MNKKIRRVGRRVLTVYNETQPRMDKRASQFEVSCRKGCNHCCSRVNLVTLPEGIAIALGISKDPKMMNRIPEISRAMYSHIEWLQEHSMADSVDCFFLNREGECGIYDYRPSECRHLLVVSDPDNCKPDSKEPYTRINLQDLTEEVHRDGFRVCKQAGLPLKLAAPLPVVVAWGFKLLEEGVEEFLRQTPNMPSVLQPTYWLNRLHAFAKEQEQAKQTEQDED